MKRAIAAAALIATMTAVGFLESCRGGAAAPLLRTVSDVPMPGAAVRFDYQSMDLAHHRLYISHMDDNHLVVFDLKSRRVIANIAGVPGSTGVLAVPEVGKIFASASRIGKVAVIDPQSLKVVDLVPAGRFPDGIAFDPGTGRIFVSDESGGADIVIDAKTNRRLARIPVGGGVGNTRFDPVSRLIMVTVGDRNQLVTIDPIALRVVNRYSLPGADHPHGLYIDAPARLAFVACDGNARVLVVDLGTMRVISKLPVGDGPDVLTFDPGLQRLYVACESGIVSVFDLHGRSLTRRGDVFVAKEAHTIAVDPRTHRVYLPLENVDGRPLLRIMAPVG